MPAQRRCGKDSCAFCHRAPQLQKRHRPWSPWDPTPRILRLSKGDMDCPIADVLPPKAEAFSRSQLAVNEHCCHVPEQKRVFRSDRLFAPLGCPDAFERAPVGFQNVFSNGGCGVKVSGLFVRTQNAVPVVLSRSISTFGRAGGSRFIYGRLLIGTQSFVRCTSRSRCITPVTMVTKASCGSRA